MFPFGSLFTQVPLIILAAAYMLYFGAYAVGKSKESLSVTEPDTKEQQLVVKTFSVSHNTFNYVKTSVIAQDADKVQQQIISFDESDISIQYYIPDRKFFSCHYSCNLFSRPPPIVR